MSFFLTKATLFATNMVVQPLQVTCANEPLVLVFLQVRLRRQFVNPIACQCMDLHATLIYCGYATKT